MKIVIAKEFSDTPGGRKILEGNYSGELFRNQILTPRYKEAKAKGEKLQIDFDGAFGYPPSFLDEAFGGLVRELREKDILNLIEIIATDDLTIRRRIEKYVRDAEKEVFKEENRR